MKSLDHRGECSGVMHTSSEHMALTQYIDAFIKNVQ